MGRVSLCSYTYDDGSILHGLLEHLPSWDRQPDEIVLFDDGSAEPFTLQKNELQLPVRLIRFPVNQGLVPTRHQCISAASGDIILALDCDSRISPDFLSRSVELLAEQDIGLVGGCSGITLGEDLFTQYSNVFGDIRKPEKSGPVDFICGAAFALRKEVWNEVGGFSGFTARLCEDHYLGSAIKAKGYKLYLDAGIYVKHARVLSRQAYCARFWKWCKDAWLNEAPPQMSLPEYYQTYFGTPTLRRCAEVIRHFPLEFFYFELLQICFIPLSLAAAMSAQGRVPLGSGTSLWRAIEKRLAPYPVLLHLLKADCLRSGALPLPRELPPPPGDNSRLATVCDWTDCLACLDLFAQRGLLDELNRDGVKRILEEEAKFSPDFSFYLESPG
jgi:glycosyltransferase involved in cell wall biosynthesis